MNDALCGGEEVDKKDVHYEDVIFLVMVRHAPPGVLDAGTR